MSFIILAIIVGLYYGEYIQPKERVVFIIKETLNKAYNVEVNLDVKVKQPLFSY